MARSMIAPFLLPIFAQSLNMGGSDLESFHQIFQLDGKFGYLLSAQQ
jgi:hypothetical protein